MRTKLVIWGTNAKEERVLLALELLPEKNEVALYVFPEEAASDDFVKSMMEAWRLDKPVDFPDNHERISRPLTLSENLLPDSFKVERGDVIQRAQSEWAFVVLSYKMQQAFRSELDTFRHRIEALEEFSQPLWGELKAFWEKVQGQVRDRNLFREHVDQLRESSDALFLQMKKLRQNADAQFRKVSSENARLFTEKLDAIHERIEEGKHLINTFDSLKQLQREYHGLSLTRDDRNKLWDRMDAAFKKIKDKRFGDKPAGGAAKDGLGRIEARLKGLLDAIGKMVKSIERDEKDLEYENRRTEASGAQLEVQLRQAKIAMIEDRVRSKKEKLADMEKTRQELENKTNALRRKIAEEEERLRVEEAKQKIKERIAKEIEESGQELKAKEEELSAAAREIAETRPRKSKAAKAAPEQKPGPEAVETSDQPDTSPITDDPADGSEPVTAEETPQEPASEPQPEMETGTPPDEEPAPVAISDDAKDEEHPH